MHLPGIPPLQIDPSAARAWGVHARVTLADSNPSPFRWRHIVGWLRKG